MPAPEAASDALPEVDILGMPVRFDANLPPGVEVLVLPEDSFEWAAWIDEATSPGERRQRKSMVFKALYSGKGLLVPPPNLPQGGFQDFTAMYRKEER